MHILSDPVRAFIVRPIVRHDSLWRIAALVHSNFDIAFDAAQVLDC